MSATAAVAKIAKPNMRGMHVNQIKKILIGATVVATGAAGAWYMLVNKPRKENYRNFYATYDADADFERMKVRHEIFSFKLINSLCSRLPGSSSQWLKLRENNEIDKYSLDL